MVRLVALTAIWFILSGVSLAQGNPSSVKLAEFNPETDHADVLLENARQLIKRLKADDKESLGFISIEPDSELGKKLEETLKDSGMRARIALLERPYLYRSTAGIVEFWFIPKGSEPPYRIGCALCQCPYIYIKGKETSSPFEDLAFTVNISVESYSRLHINGPLLTAR